MDAHPEMLVSANQRIHWSKRYSVQQYWRQRTRLMARGARWPRLERARVVIAIGWPDRRRRDVHNLLPLVGKPIVDGLVDAGLLPDDDDEHLVGPDMRRLQSSLGHAVLVQVYPLP